MDGNYQNNKKRLSEWAANVIANQLWEQYSDIHIDEIDPRYKDSRYWVEESIALYQTLISIINQDIYVCLLAIRLSYDISKMDLKNLDLDYIQDHLNRTPPSFYLFPRNHPIYNNTIAELNFAESLSKETQLKVFFKEEKEDDEYFRCVYITS